MYCTFSLKTEYTLILRLFSGKKFSDKLPKEKIIEFLEDKGNKVIRDPKFTAIVNGASKYDGHLYGHADSRRHDGGAVLY
jgi:hypothetical protein